VCTSSPVEGKILFPKKHDRAGWESSPFHFNCYEVNEAMNQNNITKLYDAQLTQQVNYCMNATAEYYYSCLTSDDAFLFPRGISYATAQRFRVGRAQGKTNLLQHLTGLGIPLRQSPRAGCSIRMETTCFKNHMVFPIIWATKWWTS